MAEVETHIKRISGGTQKGKTLVVLLVKGTLSGWSKGSVPVKDEGTGLFVERDIKRDLIPGAKKRGIGSEMSTRSNGGGETRFPLV